MKNALKNTLLFTTALTTIFLIGCGKPNKQNGTEHKLKNNTNDKGYTYTNTTVDVDYNFNIRHDVADNDQTAVYFYSDVTKPDPVADTSDGATPPEEETEDEVAVEEGFVLIGERESEETGHLTLYKVVNEDVLDAIEAFRNNNPQGGVLPQDLLDQITDEDNSEVVRNFPAEIDEDEGDNGDAQDNPQEATNDDNNNTNQANPEEAK